jgi:lipopolysaccharide transport system permease protein
MDSHETPSPLDLRTFSSDEPIRIVEPKSGWRPIDFTELWNYRDLLYYLVLRNIKIRYVQSVLGLGWAVLQPLITMIVFTLVFGRMVRVDTDGIPYAIFSYTALVPWTFFSRSLTETTNSLVSNINILNKVYIPRLIMPLAAVSGRLVDFGIAITLVFALMAWYRIAPTIWILMVPLLILLMMLTAIGIGTWLSALAVHYRDVRYGMSFMVQLMLYSTPVVYPASLVPDNLRLIYSINPMAGAIEGFRAALIGATPMPWDMLAVGTVTAVIIAVTGMFYFRRTERIFADVA